MTRTCNTPNCGRATPSTELGYCRDCIGTVLRTGRPPEVAFEPLWVRRAKAGKLPGWVRAA